MWRGQAGFTLLEVGIAALVVMLGVVWLAGRWQTQVEDAAAEATAAYLMTLRGATQAMMVHYFEPLLGFPAPDPSRELPAVLAGAWPKTLSVGDLQQAEPAGGGAFLPAGFPQRPPLGAGVQVHVMREGSCPGQTCRLRALVHTTDALRATGLDHSPELVGAFMLATQGYGAHAPGHAPERLRGALLDVANPAGPVAGVVAVTADLEATHFHQFVRQGDSRPIRLQNTLDVEGQLSTSSGLRLNTAVQPGAACSLPQAYARSQSGALATCLSGVWFELQRYVVQGWQADLGEGDALPQPQCPSPLQSFLRLVMQRSAIDVGGHDIDVRGRLSGSFSATATMDGSGQVSVSGSVGGDLASTSESRLRVRQGVSASGGRVRFENPGDGPLALAIYGCVHA